MARQPVHVIHNWLCDLNTATFNTPLVVLYQFGRNQSFRTHHSVSLLRSQGGYSNLQCYMSLRSSKTRREQRKEYVYRVGGVVFV